MRIVGVALATIRESIAADASTARTSAPFAATPAYSAPEFKRGHSGMFHLRSS
jgi:hypothetical protein